MSHTPHELHEEFPDAIEKMRALKETSAHFVKLADEYHDVNREIHRIEVEVDAASDFRADELRKTRLKLKDEIAQML